MSVATLIIETYEKKGSLMGLMKELYTEQTSIELDTAECVRCGVEIEFATSEEFEKLVNEHVHRYPLG
jgi:uncharacterized protein with PIN domain